LSAIEGLAKLPHFARHRHVADAHFAQIIIEVTAKHIEQLLPKTAASTAGWVWPGKAPKQQDHVQHDQLETPFNGIRYPVIRVKGARPRLRHDHAIERVNVAVLVPSSKRR
jgi:hypothetical protein